jgi:zinc transporter
MKAESALHTRAGIPGLVWAYRFSPDGTAELQHFPVDGHVLEARQANGGWLWLHFSLIDARACEFIAKMRLPPRARAALLDRNEHANLHLEGDTAFGALVDWHHEGRREAAAAVQESSGLGHLRFVLTDGLIVSGRRHPLRSVDSVRMRIDDGEKVESAGRMLETIIEEFAASVARAHDGMSETLDGIEERTLSESPSDERRALGLLRRRSVRLHRPLKALQRTLQQFEERHRHRSSHALLAAAARLSQRLDHLDADVVALERRARLLHDEVAAKLTEQTNRHLYVLSVLTSLFLPPTLLVGVFGMNTGGLPLTQNPAGTLVALSLCVGASLVVWMLLRRKGITR